MKTGTWTRILSVLLLLALAFSAGCAKTPTAPADGQTTDDAHEAAQTTDNGAQNEAPDPTGEVYILFTSDVHGGVDQGFGYAGLAAIRAALERQGHATLLVDDGDAVQGEIVAMMSRGEAVIDLMNALGYDAAIPGNHEFDYGVPRFFELAERAEFPYISCNFNKEGTLQLAPYVIREAAGIRIAFVGVTTPKTIVTSTPTHFQNEQGEYIYGFMQDETGAALYAAVQSAADAARAQGADLVCVMGHMGEDAVDSPYTYADVIANTTGIDVFFDGHSHDTDQVVMKNKTGQDVTRSACGTKLNCIGYSHISADKKIVETGIWSWPNKTALPALFGIDNEMAALVAAAVQKAEAALSEPVGRCDVALTVNDPAETDASGNPVRMVRRAETNLGDFCADAVRFACGADVGLVCGGGVRADIARGPVTYADIVNVHPFGNDICVVRVTGQQLLDALEWGAHAGPEEFGGFAQVSGLTYEVDLSVPSGCLLDENNMCAGIVGARRVKNVTVGGRALDPAAAYTVAGPDYTLLKNGDGYTAFDGAELLQKNADTDSRVLAQYIITALGGVVGEDYADPAGQGRIIVYNGQP